MLMQGWQSKAISTEGHRPGRAAQLAREPTLARSHPARERAHHRLPQLDRLGRGRTAEPRASIRIWPRPMGMIGGCGRGRRYVCHSRGLLRRSASSMGGWATHPPCRPVAHEHRERRAERCSILTLDMTSKPWMWPSCFR